jgi:hypothetical protein
VIAIAKKYRIAVRILFYWSIMRPEVFTAGVPFKPGVGLMVVRFGFVAVALLLLRAVLVRTHRDVRHIIFV